MRASAVQDNVRYGNEAQLLGGYAAGWLLLSAVTALVYLGFWLRAALLLRRLAKACIFLCLFDLILTIVYFPEQS